MPELCEGNIGAASEASPEYSFKEFKRACGFETKAEGILCLGHFIRDLQVHVPPSLTDTCQLRSLSRKRDGVSI